MEPTTTPDEPTTITSLGMSNFRGFREIDIGLRSQQLIIRWCRKNDDVVVYHISPPRTQCQTQQLQIKIQRDVFQNEYA